MIPSQHILLSHAIVALVAAGADPSDAAAALAPFQFVLSCRVLVQRAKLAELLERLEWEGENACGC